MANQGMVEFVGAESGEHPALQAWRRLGAERFEPERISVLSKRFKSTVYLLENAGSGGSSVVAKYCRRAMAAHERVIYDQILREVPVSYPRYYGFLEGESEYDWLFLEYAEGEQYSRSREDHSILAARWLGLLHTSAALLPAAARLPDCGPAYHLMLLRGARDKLWRNMAQLNLPATELAVIEAVTHQCDFLESRWEQVHGWCERMPLTLVHGDFKPKNAVIRSGAAGPVFLPFDWEASGWGVPAQDLAYVSADGYHATVQHRWPDMSLQDVQKMKIVGRIFRGLAEFSWESEKLEPNWPVSTLNLQIYRARMTDAIAMANWEE
ncbi:MAG TPA: aminoglycoside phosphotransferase family protein [Bryobacteraceae bacterium]|nr:aminoglycoside phosphotransferase family protein [Bryobacteraceae bacterium]